MSYEELMALLDSIELPEIHCEMEITHPHCVLQDSGYRTLLGESWCNSNVMGMTDDRVLFMFCCDT